MVLRVGGCSCSGQWHRLHECAIVFSFYVARSRTVASWRCLFSKRKYSPVHLVVHVSPLLFSSEALSGQVLIKALSDHAAPLLSMVALLCSPSLSLCVCSSYMVTQVVEWRDRCHAVAKEVQAYIRHGATCLQRYCMHMTLLVLSIRCHWYCSAVVERPRAREPPVSLFWPGYCLTLSAPAVVKYSTSCAERGGGTARSSGASKPRVEDMLMLHCCCCTLQPQPLKQKSNRT